jgi:hydrophobe/amphiphile efflux-3 (HAE3) family protein
VGSVLGGLRSGMARPVGAVPIMGEGAVGVGEIVGLDSQTIFRRFTKFILVHRLAAILILVVAVASVAFGLVWLTADFSVQAFFGRDDPETTYLNGYLERWGEDDMLLVVVDGGEQGLLTRERLEAVDGLVGKVEAVEGVAKVISLTRIPRAKRGFAGAWIPQPLLASVPRSGGEEAVAAWRTSLLADPRVVPSYLSKDGRYGVIMVALSVDTNDLTAVSPVVNAVERVVAESPTDGLSYEVAGVPAIRAHILDVIVRDQFLFVPLAGGIITLLLLLLFRSRHGVLIPSTAASVPIVMLLGYMGWVGEPINLINQSLLALVPAIAVADAIHLVSRFHEESGRLVDDKGMLSRENRDEAIIRAMTYMGVACFLTSFTTVVGFLSLLQTDLPVLRGYGANAALGVTLAYLTVLLIVPLALLGVRRDARRVEQGSEGLLGTTLETCAAISIRHPWWCVGGAAAVTVVSLWFAAAVTVDTKVTQTFYDDHPTTRANHLVDDHLGGVLAYEFDLKGAPGSFESPEVLAALQRVEDKAASHEAVRASVSVATIVRATSVLVGGPDQIPTEASVVRRLFKLNEGTPGMDALVAPEGDRARLMVRTVDNGAVAFLELGEVLQDMVQAEFAPHGVEAHLTGSSYVAYRGLSRVTSDLRDSLMSAFGVIGLIIALLFRNVWLGVISLIPNMLPLVFGYGLMGFAGWQLEPAPAIVFTIAIGVSVDSAIHVIARYREEREGGASVDEAVRNAIYHSGRGVMITAIILAVGFAINIDSSSPANASFGRLGTVVILAALPANLLVLPALLKLGIAGSSVQGKDEQPVG